MKNTKIKPQKCKWKFLYQKNNKDYMKCEICGRIKRSDLPDVQPCCGSEASYKTLMMRMTGQELTERDLIELENNSFDPVDED
ncbi:MAG: hypothetical protein ACOCV1_00650 [Bacillota bacterium]